MHATWTHRTFYLDTSPFACQIIVSVGRDGDREGADAQQKKGGKRVLTRHGTSQTPETLSNVITVF
jgi:hypothetical protein